MQYQGKHLLYFNHVTKGLEVGSLAFLSKEICLPREVMILNAF